MKGTGIFGHDLLSKVLLNIYFIFSVFYPKLYTQFRINSQSIFNSYSLCVHTFVISSRRGKEYVMQERNCIEYCPYYLYCTAVCKVWFGHKVIQEQTVEWLKQIKNDDSISIIITIFSFIPEYQSRRDC